MTHRRIQVRGIAASGLPIQAFYYDNAGDDDEIERIYQLDFYAWQEGDWDALGQIYRALPGALPEGGDLPRWFGDDEGRAPFLAASVETHGIMVYGALPPEQWERWQAAFYRRLAESHLPLYTYHGSENT